MQNLQIVIAIYLALHGAFVSDFLFAQKSDPDTIWNQITEKIRKDAENGNPIAQATNLGVMYSNGAGGVPQNYVEAAKWFRMAANQGDAQAQFNLARMYVKGQGVPKDTTEAVKLYRRAAEHLAVGDPYVSRARFILGYMYHHGHGVRQDYAEAMKWYSKAAEMGIAHAALNLGEMYYKGQGTKVDVVQAMRWNRIAADLGHTMAQHNVGYSYYLQQSYLEAAKWFQKAAEQGYANSQYNLGMLYYEGQGVPRDLIKAYKWLGLFGADLKFLEKQMTSAQLAEAKKMIQLWKKSHK